MGKNLIQQRRGKGSFAFKAPSHRYRGKAKHVKMRSDIGVVNGTVKDILHCPGHSSPVVEVFFEDNKDKVLMIAPEGIKVGDRISAGEEAKLSVGNILPLKSIPMGTAVYNIESQPGDGGKFVRSSGTSARVISKMKGKIFVELPSKKQKDFDPDCRACIGVVAGSGRKEKPFYKAGKKHHAMKARNKFYPKVTAQSMNAVDHPFGGSRSSRKGRPTIAPRFAPPGRKVGMLSPRRTGRKKRS
nr:large subunit ribosomal protein L2 [uncultured archaeon]